MTGLPLLAVLSLVLGAPGQAPSPSSIATVSIVRKQQTHNKVVRAGSVEISVYARSYEGQGTAYGETYRHLVGYTAATTRGERRVRYNDRVRVTWHGRSVIVRINDTGSTKPKNGMLWLDLNGKAFKELTHFTTGRFVARYEVLR